MADKWTAPRPDADEVPYWGVNDSFEEEGDDADADLDADGRLDLAALRASIERDPAGVALVSVMWANNEVGTRQPVTDVVALAAEHAIPVHTDAVQALGVLPVDFAASGVDAMTVTGHKVGGPHGAGALVVRREVGVVPLVHGGGQERDIRSGTLDAPAIAGFAAAVELAVARQAEHAARMAGLRERLVAGVREVVPDAVLNGPGPDAWEAERLPGNVHLSFPGCEGDSLLMLLDARGIECSTGSACGTPRVAATLACTVTATALARCANLSVEMHSSMFCGSARSVTTMAGAQLPPRLGCSSRVSLLSRYGMCCDLPSTRALMTFPRADSDKLIFVASFNLSPVACVFDWRSLPARSTS